MPQLEEGNIEKVKKGLKLLNDHLASRTFLVGHHVTLADIVAFANTYLGFTRVIALPSLCLHVPRVYKGAPPPRCLHVPRFH